MFESQNIPESVYSQLPILITNARLAAGKSLKQCAEVLGISSKKYQRFESGESWISLPELEVLSYFLGENPQSFLSSQTQINLKEAISPSRLQKLLDIRKHIFSATLQIARTEKNISFKELSELTGIPAARLKRYEKTGTAIPLNELALITKALEKPMETLLDENGVLAQWNRNQQKITAFSGLPENIQNFVTSPESRTFLELAIHLKETGIENLESIVASLQQLVEKVKS